MAFTRRTFLKTGTAVATAHWTGGLTLMAAAVAQAADWNRAAFEAKTLPDAMKTFGIAGASDSVDIVVRAPDIAENGAVVPIEITSQIPDTRSITLFADKNPQPLVASFVLAEGVEPYVSTRIKLGETSSVRVVVGTRGKFFATSKEIKVTVGGCG